MPSDSPPIVPVSGNLPPQVVIREPSLFGRFGRWLLAALVVMLFSLIGLYSRYQEYFSPAGAPQEKYHSLARQAVKKIAVVEVDGPILDDQDSFVKKQIDRVRADENVIAVVLRIDSPGGSVSASDYLYHHLQKLAEERDLPVVVSMGGMCASGGYYLAMAVGNRENSIFAEPTTWTGSIGVVIPHYDLSGALAALQVKDDSIVSGPHKLMGTVTKPMSERDQQLLQALVDDSFQRFKQVVVSGRPKFAQDPAALDAVATGQVFTANQALENGLVDRIGFIEDAVARAAELANVNTSDVRCVKYQRPQTLFGDAFSIGAGAAGRRQLDLVNLTNSLSPRAYFLWSWLPAAVESVAR